MKKKYLQKLVILTICLSLICCFIMPTIMVFSNAGQSQRNLKLEPHMNLKNVAEEKIITTPDNTIINKMESSITDTLLMGNEEDNNIILNKGISIESPAKAMCTLETTTDTILYEKNCNMQLPMASTTKIMTAIVAIEHCDDLNEIIKVSDKSVGIEGTSIYLKKDEEISIKDLLIGLILASGNDAATALAYHVGGTEEHFVEMMNETAQKIGVKNTHFDNPHGLDSKTHYTTAYDLAKITGYALNNEIFKDIVSTKFATLKATNKNDVRYLKHKNKILFNDDSCVGVKTGFTDNAGRCLVNANIKDNMTVVSVVLNCVPMFEECERLTHLAYENYEMKEFVEPYNFVGNIQIESGSKPNINVVSIKGFKKPILKTEVDEYKVEYELKESMVAPILKNQIVGEVNVKYKDRIIYSDKLYSIDDVNNVDLKYMLKNIVEKWFN